jgi:hypothetical protein
VDLELDPAIKQNSDFEANPRQVQERPAKNTSDNIMIDTEAIYLVTYSQLIHSGSV